MMEVNNMFNGMCGRIQPGMCKLSMNGAIAVKTGPKEYKTYNVKTGRLTNCSNFVFPIGEEFFFLIPTTKVKVGDIILVSGEPKCVISVKENTIEVINSNDERICQNDYTETVFNILKYVYSHKELNYILEHLKKEFILKNRVLDIIF